LRSDSIIKKVNYANQENEDTDYKIIYDYIKKEEQELDIRLQNDKEKTEQDQNIDV
jgi:hypothetical protein